MSGTIVDLFHAQVDRTPEAIALVHGADRMTYAELDVRANRLARRLRSLGAAPERLVGVCLDRSAEMVVAVLGVLKSGAGYLPMAVDQPAGRLTTMVEAAGLTAVVTQERLMPVLSGTHAPLVVVRPESPELDDSSGDHRPAGLAGPADVAYVIHTSGSTGTPKGVVVEHRSLVASTLARQSWYGRAPGGFLLLSPLSFDSSVAGLFWTLTTGGRLVVAAEDFWQHIDDLGRALGGGAVTHLLCVPSLYRALLDAMPADTLRSLDTVIVAGEACPPPLVERHRAVAPTARLVNEYGPTEATVWATACDLTTDWVSGPVPIGKPVGHVTVYLVDERFRQVQVGAVGEILIGGSGVARGYPGHASLTAERFVADPFGGVPGARLYRTGDLGRYRGDGAIEFLGRTDQQVKVNGVRVELGEIEATLVGHPAVREAAVLATGPQLAAFLTVEDGTEASASDLRAFLVARLPHYMVPGGYVVLPDLPRNSNGKVDRAALSALRHQEQPIPRHQEQTAAGPHPLTSTQRAIAQIWAEVLGVPVSAIGLDQNFFDVGGQSLLLLRVRRRIEQTLGRPVAVTGLLAHPTINSLAQYLSSAQDSEPDQVAQRGPRTRAPVRPRRRPDRRAG